MEILRDAGGEKVRRVKGGRVVGSLGGNGGVRGVWDPFRGGGGGGGLGEAAGGGGREKL